MVSKLLAKSYWFMMNRLFQYVVEEKKVIFSIIIENFLFVIPSYSVVVTSKRETFGERFGDSERTVVEWHDAVIAASWLPKGILFFKKMLHRRLFFHTPLYTSCIKKRKEERKEKVCLFEVHISTCQIFVWMSKDVLSPKGVYISLLFFYVLLSSILPVPVAKI